jgi:hypothetical protein
MSQHQGYVGHPPPPSLEIPCFHQVSESLPANSSGERAYGQNRLNKGLKGNYSEI